MKRLYFVVEGQTEEEVVKRALGPHLAALELSVSVIVVATSRAPWGAKRKGGGDWAKWERDLRRILGEQRGSDIRVTTLFDLYGLPPNFPGLTEQAGERDTTRRAEKLEQALSDRIGDRRLIPYLQRHELEALVLADLNGLRDYLSADQRAGVDALVTSLGDSAPEDINDGPLTAPSKRLMVAIPGYSKPLHGPFAIESTGLAKLRARCLRFDAWMKKLEAFASEAST